MRAGPINSPTASTPLPFPSLPFPSPNALRALFAILLQIMPLPYASCYFLNLLDLFATACTADAPAKVFRSDVGTLLTRSSPRLGAACTRRSRCRLSSRCVPSTRASHSTHGTRSVKRGRVTTRTTPSPGSFLFTFAFCLTTTCEAESRGDALVTSGQSCKSLQ